MGREEMVSGDEENIIGALTQALQGRVRPGGMGGTMRRVQSAVASVSNPRFSQTQLANQVGGGGDNKLRAPLGFGTFTFVEGAATTHNFVVEPQEAFRGERLVIASIAAGGAAVLGQVDLITVGSLPQAPSVEFGIPFSMFQPDATDAQMDWQICPAGTKIQVNTSYAGTLGEGQTFIVQVGLYGVWIRG